MQSEHRSLFDSVALALVVLFTNQYLPLCYLTGITNPRSCEVVFAPLQIIIFSALCYIILRYIQPWSAFKNLFQLIWRRNWFLVAFIGLALLSNLWSVFLPITLLRSGLLLLLALLALYFGQKLTIQGFLNFVAIAVGIIALASLALGLLAPGLGVMSNPPYEGLWRGVYWHKNYLGTTMALGYVAYLIIIFSPRHSYTYLQKVFAGLVLIVCAALAVLSDSASGLIVFVIQTGLFALILLWRLFGRLLNRKIYIILGVCAIALMLLISFNLDFVFALFNRSANATGRVPLWIYLYKTYIVERPLGHGLGTFWYQPEIPARIRSVVEWGYPVGVSDNGYMDVLLGLGFPGLILLLITLLVGLWRTGKRAYQTHELLSFFPALVVIHILFINLGLSYFMESESFIWFLLALVVFMADHNEIDAQHNLHVKI